MGTHQLRVILTMDPQNYHRYISVHGEIPKCRNCETELVIGITYIRNNHNIRAKLYCIPCAEELCII